MISPLLTTLALRIIGRRSAHLLTAVWLPDAKQVEICGTCSQLFQLGDVHEKLCANTITAVSDFHVSQTITFSFSESERLTQWKATKQLVLSCGPNAFCKNY